MIQLEIGSRSQLSPKWQKGDFSTVGWSMAPNSDQVLTGRTCNLVLYLIRSVLQTWLKIWMWYADHKWSKNIQCDHRALYERKAGRWERQIINKQKHIKPNDQTYHHKQQQKNTLRREVQLREGRRLFCCLWWRCESQNGRDEATTWSRACLASKQKNLCPIPRGQIITNNLKQMKEIKRA